MFLLDSQIFVSVVVFAITAEFSIDVEDRFWLQSLPLFRVEVVLIVCSVSSVKSISLSSSVVSVNASSFWTGVWARSNSLSSFFAVVDSFADGFCLEYDEVGRFPMSLVVTVVCSLESFTALSLRESSTSDSDLACNRRSVSSSSRSLLSSMHRYIK